MLNSLGGPATGKWTLGEELSCKYDLIHISIGSLLREAAKHRNSVGHMIQSVMDDGEHVSCPIVFDVLLRALQFHRYHRCGACFLIDSFPATELQLELWENAYTMPAFAATFHLLCSDDVLMDRVKARAIHSGRSDDNAETVFTRLNRHRYFTTNVVRTFEERGTIHSVNTERPIEECIASMESIVAPIVRQTDIADSNISVTDRQKIRQQHIQAKREQLSFDALDATIAKARIEIDREVKLVLDKEQKLREKQSDNKKRIDNGVKSWQNRTAERVNLRAAVELKAGEKLVEFIDD
eukprot:SAG31_NODE_3972_length_3704_cov_2.551734_2_plen_296_part_00